MRCMKLFILLSFCCLMNACAGLQLPTMPWSSASSEVEGRVVEPESLPEEKAVDSSIDSVEKELIDESLKEQAFEPEVEPAEEMRTSRDRKAPPEPSEKHSIGALETAKTDVFVCPPSDAVSPRQRRIDGLEALAVGKEYKAKRELNLALCFNSNDKIAKNLLEQISSDLYPETPSFKYTVADGDTLSKIAEKFLNDRFRFYSLAKFNQIENPSLVKPGEVIMIPGTGPGNIESAAADAAIESVPSPEVHHEIAAPSMAVEVLEESRDDIAVLREEAVFAESNYEKGKEHLDAGEFEQSAALLEKDLESGALDDKGRELFVSACLNQAGKLKNEGAIVKSLEYLKKAQAARPTDALIRDLVAQSEKEIDVNRLYDNALHALESGEAGKAHSFLGQVLELDPDNSDAQIKFAEVRGRLVDDFSRDAMFAYRRQELSKSVQLWDQVLALDPSNEMAKLRKAEAVDLMERLKKLEIGGR